jgi:hypothetical protein
MAINRKYDHNNVGCRWFGERVIHHSCINAEMLDLLMEKEDEPRGYFVMLREL